MTFDTMNHSTLLIVLLLVVSPTLVFGECTCDYEAISGKNSKALSLKIGAIVSILIAGALGVSIPVVGRRFKILSPESDFFFMVKAFSAGVILATGFIHVQPDSFDDLTSPCLPQNPWGNFPFTGFATMMGAIGTLMIDTWATGYYKRQSTRSDKQVAGVGEDHAHHHHAHAHDPQGHGHSHGIGSASSSSSLAQMSRTELIRHRIVAQVLELGIVVHSVIIGISLGSSQSPETIKPLIAALSFHQFFEGMGLGGCIVQARFNLRSILIMAAFFSLTTPGGIGIGIGISSLYNENSPNSLIVEGILNAVSAGILIYMALVDLLAADFMNPKLLNNVKLQLGANISLLLGAGCMSVIAKWA